MPSLWTSIPMSAAETASYVIAESRRQHIAGPEGEDGRVGDLFEVGQSGLTWPNSVSIRAWSAGMPGRPSRWAMARAAKNPRVAWLIIGPPFSDMVRTLDMSVPVRHLLRAR